jgi:hypothetical protein
MILRHSELKERDLLREILRSTTLTVELEAGPLRKEGFDESVETLEDAAYD